MIQAIPILTSLAFVAVTSFSAGFPVVNSVKSVVTEKRLDLATREPNAYINDGFTDNILLSLHYLKGDIEDSKNINWEKIRQPFEVDFVLQPDEVFAFHGHVLPQFGQPAVTMNSRFFTDEGYKSVAGLGGNGVCHLASLINWAASDAGLEVISLVDHNFYPVNGVPKEYGTSIKSQSQNQNLYIKNNLDIPVIFYFQVNSSSVDLKILR